MFLTPCEFSIGFPAQWSPEIRTVNEIALPTDVSKRQLDGMDGFRGELAQRNQYEISLCQPGMRDLKPFCVQDQVVGELREVDVAYTRWLPGELVPDTHHLTLPQDLAPGRYRLWAGMYEHETVRNLAIVSSETPSADGRVLLAGDIDFFGDPVNTASKLGEDLAVREEVLVTRRAIEHSEFQIPELAERMTARISEIEIQYVRLPMTEIVQDG